MYDPTIGRWISKDPIGFEAGDANLYRYVKNRPTAATDPSGLNELVREPTSSGNENWYMADEFLIWFNYQQVWIGRHDPRTGLVQRQGWVVPADQVEAAGDVGWADDWDAWFRARDLNRLWATQQQIYEIVPQFANGNYATRANSLRQIFPEYEDQTREIYRLATSLPGFVAGNVAATYLGPRLVQSGFRVIGAGGRRILATRVNNRIVALTPEQTRAVFRYGGSNIRSAIVNRILATIHRYPRVIDPRTGRHIPFPSALRGRVSRSVRDRLRAAWADRGREQFIREWHRRGYATPRGGWRRYDIHHIQPIEYGGPNDFWNLVPVERGTHQDLFNNFWREFTQP